MVILKRLKAVNSSFMILEIFASPKIQRVNIYEGLKRDLT